MPIENKKKTREKKEKLKSKWARFTYIGKEKKFITKLLKKFQP